jgi:shikimate dehydrogenase
MGMEDDDPLPVDTALLTASMFVGDVIAGHGVTPLIKAAESAGCKTVNGGHMVEAAQDVMADFMLQKDIQAWWCPEGPLIVRPAV